MKNVSIYGKKWLDLVFEGKNKEYGAYQLRQENSKTSAFAFLVGSFFLGSVIILMSSFNEAPAEDKLPDGTIVTIKNPYTPPVEKLVKPKTEQPKTEQPKAVKPINPIATPVATGQLTVATTATAQIDIPTTNQLAIVTTFPTGNSNGTLPSTTTNINVGGGTETTTKTILSTKELDRQPTFPGGIQNFYQFVGNNFDKEIFEGETVRVEVSFVIEKNGSLTDIKVIKKTDPSVDREAIRVLKSLRTKWTPGYKNGEPVRTQFTLPITVLL